MILNYGNDNDGDPNAKERNIGNMGYPFMI